jgi:hypothetical protein
VGWIPTRPWLLVRGWFSGTWAVVDEDGVPRDREMNCQLLFQYPTLGLAEEPTPVQPPEHEGNDEQQQQDDGHQAADEDGSWAPFCLGHRLLAPGLQLQAAEVGGRWASRPPGGWWEGAPQSWRGVIHHIRDEGDFTEE